MSTTVLEIYLSLDDWRDVEYMADKLMISKHATQKHLNDLMSVGMVVRDKLKSNSRTLYYRQSMGSTVENRLVDKIDKLEGRLFDLEQQFRASSRDAKVKGVKQSKEGTKLQNIHNRNGSRL